MRSTSRDMTGFNLYLGCPLILSDKRCVFNLNESNYIYNTILPKRSIHHCLNYLYLNYFHLEILVIKKHRSHRCVNSMILYRNYQFCLNTGTESVNINICTVLNKKTCLFCKDAGNHVNMIYNDTLHVKTN